MYFIISIFYALIDPLKWGLAAAIYLLTRKISPLLTVVVGAIAGVAFSAWSRSTIKWMTFTQEEAIEHSFEQTVALLIILGLCFLIAKVRASKSRPARIHAAGTESKKPIEPGEQ